MSRYIFDYLVSKIGNKIGAAALMGNLYVESHLEPVCLQGSYSRKLGLTSKEYTEIFDKITDTEIDIFCRDDAGYGLAQWTFWSRKKGLWSYAQQRSKSVGDLDTQLGYLWEEIQKYKEVILAIKNAKSIREASDVVALKYEKPYHTEEEYLQNRANYGQKFYDEYAKEKEENEMNSAAYVDQQIAIIKQKGIPLADQVWEAALLCVGWPYVFGAWGEYCTPSNRKRRSRDDYPTIISKCQVLSNKKSSCDGCQWYPDGQNVRCYDCRGFTDWCLKQFGIDLKGEGATSQWNSSENWSEKGAIKDGIPEDKFVCLFYTDKENPSKMAHTGYGYKGQTVECSSGVQHFTTRNKKWTHWAIPKGLYGDSPITPPDDPTVKLPTLRKGNKGPYVTLLQTMLMDRGYKLPNYGADGSFGNETETAVKQFQQDWGLTMDGIVGQKTWGVLETSPEKKALYTVTLPHLSKEVANELLAKYQGSMIPES